MVKVGDYEIREGLYYIREHFWARIEDGTIRTGATDYGQKALREVVYVELPRTGSNVEQGQPYGSIESVKAVVDLIAPVSGRIKAVNDALRDNPDAINSDPYGKGWLVIIQPSDLARAQAELGGLMDFNAAMKFYEDLAKKG